MAQPYVGEIRLFGFDFAPKGWALCDGRAYETTGWAGQLFAAIGYTYGGSGRFFNVPDLRGRAPIHYGQGTGLDNHPLGDKSGVEQVTLQADQLGAHRHVFLTAVPTDSDTLAGNFLSASLGAGNPYVTQPAASTLVPMAPNSVLPNVSTLTPHANLQPSLALNFCIAVVVDE